jgi:plasmid stabilization system protein ParE
MTYKIHITKAAERDLISAADYIEFTLCNPQAADALLNRADQLISSLSNHPERYAIVDDPVLRGWAIRFVQVNNYLAFYTVSEKDQTVHIVRFLYGKRDWMSILQGGFGINE